MKKIGFLLACLALLFLADGEALAEQHDRLLPLLRDLEGWQAQPAQGTSLASAQMKMISAVRSYSREDKNLTVNIMVNSGPLLDIDLQESSSEDANYRIQSRQVDGFWIKSTSSKRSASGQVIVHLDYNQEANAVLIVEYVKMSEEEVLRTVKVLDWPKLKKVVSPML